MFTRTRGYLPHHILPEGIYFVTFRLNDSLPESVLREYRQELETKLKAARHDSFRLVNCYRRKVEDYLDSSYGECFLRIPKIAETVATVLSRNDALWYLMHAYTIMPNHVHALFSVNGTRSLSEIVQNWKGASAFYCNKLLQRAGTFWQREYFDRTIKSERQFEFAVRYIQKSSQSRPLPGSTSMAMDAIIA